MPPLPPAPSVIETKFHFTYGLDTNIFSHLFWHDTSGPAAAADLQTWANAVEAAFTANHQQDFGNWVKLTAVEAIDLGNPGTQHGLAAVNVAGTLPGSTLTAETAVLINLRIGRSYRGGKPRLYMPFGASSELQDSQHWTSSFLTSVSNHFSAFVNSLLGAPGPGVTSDHLANVSYHSGGALRPSPVVDPVLGWSVNAIPGSQRRRMGR